MKVRLMILLMLLLSAGEALACPGCTYESMMNEHWYEKLFIIKLAAVALFTFNRLDPVRTLYTFLFYTCGYVIMYKYLVWYSHPAVTEGAPRTLALGGLVLAELNVLDFGLLWLISHLSFYRKDTAQPLPVWQMLAYAVAVFLVRRAV